jgi:hypothetical protein
MKDASQTNSSNEERQGPFAAKNEENEEGLVTSAAADFVDSPGGFGWVVW